MGLWWTVMLRPHGTLVMNLASVYLLRLSDCAVDKLCSWVAPLLSCVPASRIGLIHNHVLCLIGADTASY